MRKVFKLDEIDCAVCAGKLEDAIKKLDGVQDARRIAELEAQVTELGTSAACARA